MRIHCPHCGERDQGEFTYLGDGNVRRPQADAGPDAFFDYVYIRDNVAGLHRERWYHAFGCRSWIDVVRDVRTHEIKSVEPARAGSEARP